MNDTPMLAVDKSLIETHVNSIDATEAQGEQDVPCVQEHAGDSHPHTPVSMGREKRDEDDYKVMVKTDTAARASTRPPVRIPHKDN